MALFTSYVNPIFHPASHAFIQSFAKKEENHNADESIPDSEFVSRTFSQSQQQYGPPPILSFSGSKLPKTSIFSQHLNSAKRQLSRLDLTLPQQVSESEDRDSKELKELEMPEELEETEVESEGTKDSGAELASRNLKIWKHHHDNNILYLSQIKMAVSYWEDSLAASSQAWEAFSQHALIKPERVGKTLDDVLFTEKDLARFFATVSSQDPEGLVESAEFIQNFFQDEQNTVSESQNHQSENLAPNLVLSSSEDDL